MQRTKTVFIFAFFVAGIFQNGISQNLPANFVIEDAAPGATFETPTSIAFAPDGRLFVAEKGGKIFIVQNGVKLGVPFIDLEIEVHNNRDRGLLGIALDPNFSSNRYIYLLYGVDPNGDGADEERETFGRLTRYTASASNPNLADLSSRLILIGANWSQGIPLCHNSHGTGSIHFGSDGSLLLSSGDAAPSSPPDAGGNHPIAFGPGKLSADQDIGSFRAQYLGTMAGKILRIDPATGLGLPSNPYFTGNASDIRSKIWAYGLRNPFRFAVRPNGSANPNDGRPGTLYIGDVGQGDYEDLNVSKAGGENFGWPCFEGPQHLPEYEALTPPHGGCSTIGAPENPATHTLPLMHWHHSDPSKSLPTGVIGATAIGGVFYSGNSYPSEYLGGLFFADYTAGWIRYLKVDQNDNFVSAQDFAAGVTDLVDLQFNPVTGNLFYVDIVRGQIFQIKYTGAQNQSPVANGFADHLWGYAPLAVQFTGSASLDPDQDPLTYSWSFGDGETSTQADPLHTYSANGAYTVTLTVTDDHDASSSRTLSIVVGSTPPQATISSPLNGASYLSDETIALNGNGEDADEAPANLQYLWVVNLHHNTHAHPATTTINGKTGSFTLGEHADPGDYNYLEIELRVTDSSGLSDTTRSLVVMKTVGETDITGSGTPIALITNPSGNGNPNIEVIRDNIFPPLNSSDPLQQYDTNTGGGARPEDWIGYEFSQTHYFSKLIFQEGMHFANGGWFENPKVQVRSAGAWSDALYVSCVPSYPGNNGIHYESFALLFLGASGEAIRLIGPPRGSDNFISVGELRVIASPAPSNSALRFDGVNDYVEIADNAALSGAAGKSITVEAWVKPEAVNGNRPIAHKYLDGRTKDWGIQVSDGALEAAIESGGDNWSAQAGSIPAGVWSHVAFAFDNAANIARLFINGVEVGQKVLSKDMPNSAAPVRIGRHGYSSEYFQGEIDELRAWNFARNAAQISAGMNHELSGTESGLIGYWRFDEGGGQTAGDQTSNGNHGLLGSTSTSDGSDPVWVTSSIPLGSTPTSLHLNSPNGGESWTAGSNQSIIWSSQGTIANVKLEFSTNNGAAWTTISGSAANGGSHAWTVPNTPSSNGLVRISDAVDGDPFDISDGVFSIIAAPSPPSMTSFSPASGPVGIEVTILGNNFTGAISVKFNAVAAGTFVFDSDTQLRAVVPSGATTGKISVTTANGSTSSANDFTVTASGGITTLTFQPSDDAYVKLSSATSSYGGISTLRARKTGSETLYSFLKFPVNDLAGPVQSATLRLYVTDASPDGGSVYVVSNDYKDTTSPWKQQGLNWNNAPLIAGTALGATGAVSVGSWVEVDVTSTIAGNGTYSFGLKNNSSDAVNYSSQEGSNKPLLVIETGVGTPPPSAPTISVFNPTSGAIGIEVTITGSNFTGAISVTFNGAAAVFVIDSATQIRATAPSGATSGKISVTTPDGSALSANDFNVASGGGTTTTLTFTPLHDAYVRASTATTNYGGVTALRLRKSGSEALHSYLKFEVSGIGGALQSAKLRLYVTDAGSDGGAVYAVSSNYLGTNTAWLQSGLNWNNAPAISGTALSSVGAVSVGSWVEFDVIAAVTGNGIFSFGLTNNSSDAVYYSSREGSNKPQLVIQATGAATIAPEVEVDEEALPAEFSLSRNYPNPFNAQTRIDYTLPEESNVLLIIYNSLGQKVRELVNEFQPAGYYHVVWNGVNASGEAVGSGIYFYRLQAESMQLTGKMVFLP